jgi:hypothetical protein
MVLAGVIAWQLLRNDLKMGISFSIASFLAIYSGIIYKSRAAIVLVIVGIIMGTLAFRLVPELQNRFASGDYVGLGIILFIMLVIWMWAQSLKEGEVPRDWKK